MGSSHIRPRRAELGQTLGRAQNDVLASCDWSEQEDKSHHYLGNQTTGKAVPLGPLPLPEASRDIQDVGKEDTFPKHR